MSLSVLDWGIIALYMLFSVLVGFFYHRSASKGLAAYFVADRSLPWWLLGISMVATTFASDTPLAVTGIIAKDGISGNWFWWALAFSHLMVVFVLARFWRRTGVVTDAELIELRYDGNAAAALRGFKAFFFAIIINCITMGWVIRAVGKIFQSFVDWRELTPGVHQALAAVWPEQIAIRDPGEGLSILVMSLVTLLYSVMGGLKGVVIADLVQFLIAMAGSIAFAWFAVDKVGGLDAMLGRLHEMYPAGGSTPAADQILGFFPQGMAGALLFSFLTYVTVQWWAQHNCDGGGYFAQRNLAARDEHHAYKGMLLFSLLHYIARTWPWIMVGLAALIIFPLVPPEGALPAPDYARVLTDREAAYPILAVKLLPSGMLGLLVASLMAAFMSTLCTHINWGSSYLVNDLYKRFVNPKASEAQLVVAGKAATALVFVLGLAVTTQVDSIKGAWEFFTALGAGLGLPHMLRWLWWRMSAWSEIAGLTAAALTTALLYVAAPELPYFAKLLTTVGVSVACMLAATFLMPPVSLARLQEFYTRVRPLGFWGPVARSLGQEASPAALGRGLAWWAAGCVALFASMYGMNELLVGVRWVGAAVVAASVAAWVAIIRGNRRVDNGVRV